MTRFAKLMMFLAALLSLGINPAGALAQEKDTTQRLTAKVERIKAGVQQWSASGRDASEIAKTMQEKFHPLMEAGKIVEAEALLDSMLKLLGMDASAPPPASSKSNGEPSDEERLLTRIHMIQKELPAWVKKTGKQAESDALMQKLKEQLAAMNYAEAEQTANSILELIGVRLAVVTQPEQPTATKESKKTDDPFAALFAQQLVFLARDRIALTQEQLDALRASVNKTQPRLVELQKLLERESATLKAMTGHNRLDEATILAELDKFLNFEREAKQLQVGLGVTIHNLLTADQQAKLRVLGKNPEVIAKLTEELMTRVSAKVDRVQAGAQRWAQSGRDPSVIAQAMEEKVRPLMGSERAFEAEVELDRVLELLEKDTK